MSAGRDAASAVPAAHPVPEPEWRGIAYDAAVVILLVGLIALALWVRGLTIWPQAVGLDEAPYEDEGVYAAAAQMLREGKQPYRDFFFAHPPLGPALYAPATDFRYTTWGSPTTFIILRYAATLYGALAVGLTFLIGWRLWGLLGGVVAGLILALDPQAVWAGRHVMLESPFLFLAAVATLAYVVARELPSPPLALLPLAGFFAAAAGGVKLQGLAILAAMVIDLAVRRRGRSLFGVAIGALLFAVPLGGYFYWLRAADPLGQFVWLQLLRPADGLVGLTARLRQIGGDLRLALVLAGLGLLALPVVRARRIVYGRRAGDRLELQRLSSFDEADAPPRPVARPAFAAIGATSQAGPATPTAGWTILLPWTLLVVAGLLLARSYYAHYSGELAMPLALLAGALPLGIERALRAGWGPRLYGLGLAAALIALCVWLSPTVWGADTERQQDRLYSILGRYAGDAVGPERAVFALDVQIPFRAARRPAREVNDRFIVDGYGSLLYQGLGIASMPLGERFRQLGAATPGDPYAIMWRPAVQERLRASMARSDLIVIDAKSDGRLTDETRQWLATNTRLEERQARYAIYRVVR